MAIRFDELSDLDVVTGANAGAWLTLLDVNGNPTKRRLKLLGTNSEIWRNGNYKEANLRQKALQKAGKPHNPTAQETEELIRKRVVGVTVDWDGFPDESGGNAPFTPESVYALYSHPKVGPHVFPQALDFILDPANFGEAGEKEANPLDPVGRMAEVAGN